MFRQKKPRGATPLLPKQRVTHAHIVIIAGITAIVTLLAIIAPSGDVEANRNIDVYEAEPAAVDSEPSNLQRLESVAVETEKATSAAVPEPAQPAVAASAAEPESEDGWRELIVRGGDNLSLLFKRAGFSTRDVYEVVSSAEHGKALERIYPGQTIAFRTGDNGELDAVRHTVSRLESTLYERNGDSYESRKLMREPEVRRAWASGEIESSLFIAGQQAGLSVSLIMELTNVFGGVIDFVLDPRKGDTMHVLYEELYLDGEKYSDGQIIAASYTNSGETFNAFRYTDSNGLESFYNEQGVSMRKAFLMAPVDFTRISSNFNLRRKHPIYKTTRPHRGTDYAAPRGTPVFASGDGRVIEAGYTRANGNYVFIQHGERYITKYLHLHKRKVKQGQRVVQSQVIGTVGATGAATGPHLHYEFLVNGVHRNPRTIHKELPKAKSLPETEMATFQLAIAEASQQLAMLQRDTQLALSQEAADAP